MTVPFVVLAAEIDPSSLKRPPDGILRTAFWDVGEGFAIRAVVHAPKGNQAEVTYEWSPCEPTSADPLQPDPERLESVYRALDIRIYLYYAIVYGFFPERMEVY